MSIEKSAPAPAFWRDEKLPFIEARSVEHGLNICYARHAHETFSIGAINGGISTYFNGREKETVGPGAVVVINPGDVHACNRVDEQAWSYCMLYVDAAWLTKLQHALGFSRNGDFRAFSAISTRAPFARLNRLHAILTDVHASHLHKEEAAIGFFSDMQQLLDPAPRSSAVDNIKLARAAQFINDNFTRALTVDDICAAAHLSPAHLIRSFKIRFGMTPHAFLTNRRIQRGLAQLKLGVPIATVALDVGFADQAHFQRAFKRHLAATPGQYRAAAGRMLVP